MSAPRFIHSLKFFQLATLCAALILHADPLLAAKPKNMAQPTHQFTALLPTEPVLNKANLDRVKKYIIASGARRTYTNMYNNNPYFETANYQLHLNPDPGGPHNHGQWNIHCDPARGDFNTMVVETKSRGSGYGEITFLPKTSVTIITAHHVNLTAQTKLDIKKTLEAAVTEMLRTIDASPAPTE